MPSSEDYAVYSAIRPRAQLLLLQALRGGARRGVDLAEATGLNQSNVTRALRVLCRDGLAVASPGGHALADSWGVVREKLRVELGVHVDRLERVLGEVTA